MCYQRSNCYTFTVSILAACKLDFICKPLPNSVTAMNCKNENLHFPKLQRYVKKAIKRIIGKTSVAIICSVQKNDSLGSHPLSFVIFFCREKRILTEHFQCLVFVYLLLLTKLDRYACNWSKMGTFQMRSFFVMKSGHFSSKMYNFPSIFSCYQW